MLTQFSKTWTSLLTASVLSVSVLAGCSSSPTAQQPQASSTTTAANATCAPDVKELDFGIISTESQDNLKPKWDPFIDAMEAQLGRPINAFYATDYAAVIEAMGANKIQLAWYGGKSYIEAVKRSNAEAFARVVNEDGTKGYYAYLITNKDNPILSKIDVNKGNGDQYVVQHAAELTFAFNDPESTSGFLVPSYYVFAKNGVNPNEAFKQLTFAGSHEATAQAVANNQVDVATNNSEILTNLKNSEPDTRAKIQVIWTSPEIPSDPLAYRNDLPDCLKEQVRNFFYSYKNASILKPLGWAGFEAAKDEDWNTIRELNIGKEILEVQNDKNLSEQQKQEKLDELNKQLEALK
ncbi:MAG TPA: phosphonate ABC transporter substrate-binding protein [Crinalium sp.]